VLIFASIWYYNFVKMEGKQPSMQAVVREWGNLVFKAEYAVPKPGPNEVLIRVQAAAINPVDYKAPRLILGKIVGIDVAGIVESTGTNVTKFAVGDEVYGAASGSLATFAVSSPDKIALKAKNISFAEAAAMPVTYLTALQGLRDYGAFKEGGRVLVIGASGGCGTAILQVAKSMKAGTIVAVCSGKNTDFVKSHGADEVVDYTQHNTVNYFRDGATTGDIDESKKFNVVFDAATNSGGGEDYRHTAAQLLLPEGPNTPHGQYVAINGGMDMWLRKFTIGQKKNEHLFLTDNNTADLDCLSKLVDDGYQGEGGEQKRLAPVIAELLPFNSESVTKGFDLLKTRRVVGKVVFDMVPKE